MSEDVRKLLERVRHEAALHKCSPLTPGPSMADVMAACDAALSAPATPGERQADLDEVAALASEMDQIRKLYHDAGTAVVSVLELERWVATLRATKPSPSAPGIRELLNEAIERLTTDGFHRPHIGGCPSQTMARGPCTCGLADILARLRGAASNDTNKGDE